jgi:hypothetical protein
MGPVEREHRRAERRIGQRRIERPRRPREPAVLIAGHALAVPDDDRMAAEGLGDHPVVERRRVVGAEEPPRRRVGERQVEQPLVPLAFDELVAASSGPDRLSDPTDGPVGTQVVCNEPLPGRDDPGGVCADVGHVGEEHCVGVAVQLLA